MAQQKLQKTLKKNSKIALQYVHSNSFFPNFFLQVRTLEAVEAV